MRKFVQISAVETRRAETVVVALADDGTVWAMPIGSDDNVPWVRLRAVPQSDVEADRLIADYLSAKRRRTFFGLRWPFSMESCK
ncbi:TPA: hypothetical protein ACU9T0_005973 [Burkholderia cenocepacia]|uniref:Uncharacterized protein n=1 Tax=Burkholderia vietnamiensis TaxID=60552 RepID=A0ABS1AXI2_BURVI|nr:hypothetical protein [Burkholderia vietnamiensis]MBJ9688867.1 hypothetical protein [Burkholderia vietnamiensis]